MGAAVDEFDGAGLTDGPLGRFEGLEDGFGCDLEFGECNVEVVLVFFVGNDPAESLVVAGVLLLVFFEIFEFDMVKR
ncbi:hypothetical protein BEL04_08620 [Mucilaginibacter sp. PPCGB 2223]|uniref:hypothetical protein n=1 Tax=Mucilaginibacter sp. PPCGB 2223 TaxID=1886027 RepID=UPI000824BE52|nr:hypothetical protein [Mucilaginibacter sp. PPCGB 2223]OCX54312.1 hypothetical protein BEL04_08620 [Mucilaginibacter sp. PPCGB 2223]